MIIPDINLLVYAYNADSVFHSASRNWLEHLLSGTESMGLPWTVIHGYIRIMTHPRIMVTSLQPSEAVAHVRAWLEVSVTTIIEPGRRHLDILSTLLDEIGSAGNITTDAVLAALAIEYQAELHSNDADFSRFSGLKWVSPV